MPATPSWLHRHAHLVVLLLALAALAPFYATALLTPAVGIYHDDSLYINTARALAEGRGYWIESTPVPLPQTKYPALFPALLALVWKMAPDFPANLVWFKAVPLLAALLWFGLSFVLIRRESGSVWLATTAVIVTAACPQVIFLSTAVLSETLFATLTTGCLMLWLQHARTGNRGALLGAAVLAAAAYHTRTIGFCLILAGLVALLRQRKFRDAVVFGLVCAALASPWLLWQTLNRSSPDPYLSQHNYYNAYNIVVSFSWAEKLRIALTNLAFLPFSVSPLFYLSWGGVLGLIAAPFAIRALWQKEFAAPVRWLLLLSYGVILLWVWPPLRFLVPLLPLLVWSTWAGLPARLRLAFLVGCGLLAAEGWWVDRQFSTIASHSGIWCPIPTPDTEWSAFAAQLDWIRKNTPPEAIIQANLDPTVYLFTGRRAIRGSHGNASLSWYLDSEQPLGTAAEFRANLLRNQITYILDTPSTRFLETKFLTRLIEENLKSGALPLTLETQSPDGKFRIYRLGPTAK